MNPPARGGITKVTCTSTYDINNPADTNRVRSEAESAGVSEEEGKNADGTAEDLMVWPRKLLSREKT